MSEPNLTFDGTKWVGRRVDGRMETEVSWSHEPTPDQWARFLAGVPQRHDGRLTVRRWVVGPVTLFAGKDVSRPPWPWPKVLLRFKEGIHVGAGWRMTAYHLHVTVSTSRESMARK